jgi:ABC-2 type transport system ATP-binding protein
VASSAALLRLLACDSTLLKAPIDKVHILFDEVSKYYHRRPVLKSVSFEFDGPGLLGVAGNNGSGKTTLLKILAGFLDTTSGSATIVISRANENQREILGRLGFLPQSFTYPGSISIEEFVQFASWLRGGGKRTEALANAAIAAVGLSDQRDLKLGRASGGTIRRAGFAAAIVDNPSVLLLDEPTTGVDPEQRQKMRSFIAEQAVNRLVIMSSHIAEDLEVLANRLVVLRSGTLVYKGTVEQCITTYGVQSLEDAIVAAGKQ